jgi:hypothetical protein
VLPTCSPRRLAAETSLLITGPELSQQLIRYLVKMGETESFGGCDSLIAQFPRIRSGNLMRLPRLAWRDVAASLGDTRLVALIKTLTMLDRRLPDSCSGSASPINWLFEVLSERSQEDLTPVIDWVLFRTDNPYLPFGRYSHDAKSLAQLHARSAQVFYVPR